LQGCKPVSHTPINENDWASGTRPKYPNKVKRAFLAYSGKKGNYPVNRKFSADYFLDCRCGISSRIRKS
jgi:hypothetical protein